MASKRDVLILTPMNAVLPFGQQIKLLRKKSFLSQEDLAERCALSTSTISKIERDKYPLSPPIVRLLARELEVLDQDYAIFAAAAYATSAPSSDNEVRAGKAVPYVGLHPFQEQDARFFFGREHQVQLLLTKLMGNDGLVVIGASGSGKSSVVSAGLLPALRQGALPDSATWRILPVMTPGAQPIETLAELLTADRPMPAFDLESNLAQTLRRDPTTLLRVARRCVEDHPARFVIIVDQAEELWTQGPLDTSGAIAFNVTQRQPFLANLLTAATSPDSPLVLIIAMRADFVHRAVEDQALAAWMNEHLVIIRPMTPAELQRAIAEPAQLAGCQFEDGLVEELVAQTSERPGALPLLQYTLLALWQQRSEQRITWAAYKRIGGVERAIASRADIVFQHFADADRERICILLQQLVRSTEEGTDTRRRMPLTDLMVPGIPEVDVLELLEPFIAERLVTIDVDPVQQQVVVELTHEALIRAWPTLQAWVDTSRADRLYQRKLDVAAREWQQRGKKAEFLWLGERLDEAERWEAQPQTLASELVHQFLRASRVENDRREEERRRLRKQESEQEQLRLRVLDQERMHEQQRAEFAERKLLLERRARHLLNILTLALSVIMVVVVIAVFRPVRNIWLRQQARSLASPIQLNGMSIAFEPYEVTNGRFRMCVAADVCNKPLLPRTTYFSKTVEVDSIAIDADLLPVTGIDAVEARMFCSWVGRRVPSYSEWSALLKQAPDVWDGLQSSAYQPGMITAPPYPRAVSDKSCIQGICDLIGNVWEWTAPSLYDGQHSTDDPANVKLLKVTGGSFKDKVSLDKLTLEFSPFDRYNDIGFRCVEP